LPEELVVDAARGGWRYSWLLKGQGWYQRDIAEALGVREETVCRWLARARDGGPEALRARPGSGHPPKLSDAQKRLIPEFLWHGPEVYGFRGQVWTRARIAEVIEQEFGIRYHKGHVGRLQTASQSRLLAQSENERGKQAEADVRQSRVGGGGGERSGREYASVVTRCEAFDS